MTVRAELGMMLGVIILVACVVLALLHYTVAASACLLIGNALGFGSFYALHRS